jgi:hypothetical protein
MYFILECDKSYFVKNLSDSYKKLSETDIVKMQDLFYCVVFFQQTVGTPMGTNLFSPT